MDERKKRRSSDAEAVAALIWLAFVVPEDVIPLEDDGRAYLSFHRALDLYADARDRERAAHEADLRSVDADRQQLLQEVEAEAADHFRDATKMVPDPDTAPAPQPPEHTHTHTQAGRASPKSDDGGACPAPFVGVGSGEKRKIYERLTAYCAAHGLGSARKIAEATNGVLSHEDVRRMKDAEKYKLSQWRALDAALDRLENKDQK